VKRFQVINQFEGNVNSVRSGQAPAKWRKKNPPIENPFQQSLLLHRRLNASG
jgi:hypothetical protein